jgi:hypothetical protein
MKSLSEHTLKAVNSLYSIFPRIKFEVKTNLLIFDRMVEPIQLYCADVLVFTRHKFWIEFK